MGRGYHSKPTLRKIRKVLKGTKKRRMNSQQIKTKKNSIIEREKIILTILGN